MIISALLTLIIALLSVLFAPLSWVALPSNVANLFLSVIQYLIAGCKIIAAYTHFSYLVTLFGFVAIVDIALFGYKVIMWILRKIPFLNIK